MTVQAFSGPKTAVECTELADGRLVRLTGFLGTGDVPALRLALLGPLPDSCRDVVVDAGDVDDIDDDALAVLLAAPRWAESCGSRLRLSRSSVVIDATLATLGLDHALPRLSELPPAPAPRPVPLPRESPE